MEPTIPLQQMLGIVRSTSPTPSRSSAFRHHPSFTTDRNRIRLNLEEWEKVFAAPIDTEERARTRINQILDFFINVARSNGLELTPAFESLQTSLSILRRGGDFTWEAAKKNWRERIVQLSTAKTDSDRITSLRNLCLHGFPIFNIWDSISFIYTLCAEDVMTQVGAELLLYQFRMIVKALRQCETWFSLFAGPTTVAASWKEEHAESTSLHCFRHYSSGAEKERQHERCHRRSEMRIYEDYHKGTQEWSQS
jgi:hypothetical protein